MSQFQYDVNIIINPVYPVYRSLIADDQVVKNPFALMNFLRSSYLLDDLVVKLFGAAPLADAAEAVGVAAAGQDAEAPLGWRRLLVHHLHADTAHLLLALLHGKRLLHVLLKRSHTHLRQRSVTRK